MEAIDYVKLFKLDQENFNFKREEFISELGKEFLEYCQTTTIGRDNKSGIIYYYRFREIVKNFESKFWAISKLKVGEPLSQNYGMPFCNSGNSPKEKVISENAKENRRAKAIK